MAFLNVLYMQEEFKAWYHLVLGKYQAKILNIKKGFMFRRKQVYTTPEEGQEHQQILTMTVHELDEEIRSFDLINAPKSATFTPHDLYLLQQAGYEPIQVVVGNIVYSMGIGGVLRSLRRGLRRGEVPDFTQLLQDGRVLARNRMLEYARAVKADAVFGVVLETEEFADFIEVTATGTACRKIGEGKQNTPISVGA